LHTTVLPSGQTVGVPVQLLKLQPCVFGALSHVREHEAFWPHSAVQLWSRQVNAQLAPAAQTQLPFAHSALHVLFCSQATWQGLALHENVQLAPGPHEQSPSAHSAPQLEFCPQSA
jgi:hypothetical protein